MSYIYMYVQSGKATGCLSKTCNGGYPNELVHESWKNLRQDYVKTDILSASKLIQEMHRLKLKEEGDSTELFDKI